MGSIRGKKQKHRYEIDSDVEVVCLDDDDIVYHSKVTATTTTTTSSSRRGIVFGDDNDDDDIEEFADWNYNNSTGNWLSRDTDRFANFPHFTCIADLYLRNRQAKRRRGISSSGNRDYIVDEEKGPCNIDFSLFAMDPATAKKSRVKSYEERAISREKRDAKKPKR